MSSTAPPSNQDKGKGKQTCRRQQALIAAYWATQVQVPDNALPILEFRLFDLKSSARKALRMLKRHPCTCIDCTRPIPQIGDRNSHATQSQKST